MRRVLITGSRTWTDWHTIEVAIREEALKELSDTVVVHGAADGADSLAGYLAQRMGLVVEVHPAEWKVYGRSAGFVRNRHMVGLGADVCLAFIKDRSRGATMCARLAREAGIPVKEYLA